MGKLFAGMLSAVVLLVGLGGSAQAAEIPPTDECVATFKTSLRTYYDELDAAVGNKQEEAAERKWAVGLADAGCVSDAEPLIKLTKAKPFADQCSVAAKAAGDFWGPTSRRVKRVNGAHVRRNRQLHVQRRRANERISKLRRQGASKKRVRPLLKRSRQLGRRIDREHGAIYRDLRRLVGPTRFANSLIYLELISLRCLDWNVFDESSNPSEKPKGPATRLVQKDSLLVQASFLFAFIDSSKGWGSDAGTASAGIPALPGEVGLGGLGPQS